MDFIKKFLELEGAVAGVPLKYGAQRGNINATVDVPLAASVVVDNSGRFITLDTSGNAIITVASSVTLFGFIEAAAQTASGTAGATVLPAIVDTNTIFRIPVNQAVTAGATAALWKAIVGKKLDVRVDSDVQGLDADVSTRAHVIVVGVDQWKAAWSSIAQSKIDQSCRWVDVKINAVIQGK